MAPGSGRRAGGLRRCQIEDAAFEILRKGLSNGSPRCLIRGKVSQSVFEPLLDGIRSGAQKMIALVILERAIPARRRLINEFAITSRALNSEATVTQAQVADLPVAIERIVLLRTGARG